MRLAELPFFSRSGYKLRMTENYVYPKKKIVYNLVILVRYSSAISGAASADILTFFAFSVPSAATDSELIRPIGMVKMECPKVEYDEQAHFVPPKFQLCFDWLISHYSDDGQQTRNNHRDGQRHNHVQTMEFIYNLSHSPQGKSSHRVHSPKELS